MFQAFEALLDPGDEVLLPTPYWTSYPEGIRLAGGVPVPVLTDERSGYLTSASQVLSTFSTIGTKLSKLRISR